MVIKPQFRQGSVPVRSQRISPVAHGNTHFQANVHALCECVNGDVLQCFLATEAGSQRFDSDLSEQQLLCGQRGDEFR